MVSRLVLTGGNAIVGDGTTDKGVSVVVDGNVIVEVGPQSEVHPLQGDEIVDASGCTLMPGMVTCHFHSTYRDLGASPVPFGLEHAPAYMAYLAADNARIALRSGYTGAVGASCAQAIDASLHRAIVDGLVEGPRLVPSSHDLITSGDSNDTSPWYWDVRARGAYLTCDGTDEFRKTIRQEVKAGARIIKLYATGGHGVLLGKQHRSMSHDELKCAVETSHERGVRVRAHVVTKEAILSCVEAGVDIIDHADGMDQECIEAFVESKTYVVPSLLLPLKMMEMMDPTGTLGFTSEIKKDFEHTASQLRKAHDAGVKLVVGDDYGAIGLPHGLYSDELAVYVDYADMRPLEVLTWATKNGAELLETQQPVGTLTVGSLADILVIAGDPADDITVLRDQSRIRMIVADGRAVTNADHAKSTQGTHVAA